MVWPKGTKKYTSEIVPSIRDYVPWNGKSKEILDPNKYSTFNGVVQYLKYLLINELEKLKKLMSTVKKTQSATEIYETLISYFVRFLVTA